MPGSGSLSHFGIAKESSWATFVVPTDFLKFNSESLTLEVEKLISAQLHARRDEPNRYPGLGTIAGDSSHELHPEGSSYLLHSFNSSVVSTLVEAGVYSHVFKPTNSPFSVDCFLQPYSLEIHKDFSDEAFRFSGAVINALTMEFSIGTKIAMITPSWIAKDVILGTQVTPSLETTRPFLWKDAVIKFDDVQFNYLEAFSFAGDQAIVGVPLLNNTDRIAAIESEGYRTGALTMTFRPQDMTYWTKFKNYTPVKVEVTLTGDTIGVSSNYLLKLTFPRVIITAFAPVVEGPGRITVEATGDIEYDSSSGYMWEMELVNTKTAL